MEQEHKDEIYFGTEIQEIIFNVSHDDKDGDDNHWQSAALCLLSSLQLKNFPLNSWTPTTAKMNCNHYNHRSGEPKSHIDYELSSCKPGKGGRRAEC